MRGGKSMTKAELVAKMADAAGITKAVAEKALNSLIDAFGEALSQGEKITLVGFGTFDVSERAAREGRNPRTGDTIKIPASKVVRFKPGNKLKDVVK
ncbi:MAG: HU family DNA-binding protein [Acidobacteriota bacterium]